MKKIKYKGLSTLEVLEGANNYNNWIAYEILRFVKNPIIEIGSGTGNLSEKFLNYGQVLLSDNDNGLVKVLNDRFKHFKNGSSIRLDIEKDVDSKYYNTFRSVIAVNVLEHIDDDRTAIKNIGKLLKKGGTVNLLVPAKRLAYTRLDRELGHYRRYEKNELYELLRSAGFSVDQLYFFNVVGLVSWIVRDKVEKSSFQLKPYQVALFDKIVPLLRFVETRIRPPIGISLIAVATKK